MKLPVCTLVVALLTFGVLSRLIPASAATDTVPPRIAGSAMIDLDRDGRADRIVLTYSEKVVIFGEAGGGPFSVAGYRITGTGHTHGSTTVTLDLAEKASPDPDAAPAVTYSPFACGEPSVVDLAGNEAPAQVFSATKPLAGAAAAGGAGSVAAAAPKIIAAAVQDTDDDEKADQVLLTYSRKVTYPGETDGSTLFTVDGYRILKVKKAQASTTLALVLEEKARADTTAAPDIGYCAPEPGDIDEHPPVRDSIPIGNGRPAPSQVFIDTTSIDETVVPDVTVTTVGKLAPGIPGALECSGAFIKVGDEVRTRATIESTGRGRCKATFANVPRGATIEVSILGSAGATAPAVGGCDEFTADDKTPGDNRVQTSDLTLTRSGFGECVV